MNDPVLDLLGRNSPLFLHEIHHYSSELISKVNGARFLVLGAAGSIGSAVTKEIALRSPMTLHLVDISENNLVELVRDLRSSLNTLPDDFQALALDVGSIEYDAFIDSDGKYDYVLNLSALKHVRSEKDPFTLMRMIQVNIINTEKTIQHAIDKGVKKYFCVSTDKAANPVNLMGASKRIMEMFLVEKSKEIDISTARFANVAFSDGSLLYGFDKRLEKQQPIVAPSNIKRYFITKKESGLLCLFSCLLGENRDIFFPKPSCEMELTSFSSIAIKYLKNKGYDPILCLNESEAKSVMSNRNDNTWPCLFENSNTTGEKPFEEFFTKQEDVDFDKFNQLGVVKLSVDFDSKSIVYFKDKILQFKKSKVWTKEDLISIFYTVIPNLKYKDIGKYLDSKM